MKVRNGFVTNSSSSSFIVSLPLSANVKFDIKDETSLRKYIEEYYGDDFDEIMQGKYPQKRYRKLKQILDSGKGIVMGSISNDDYENGIIKLLETLGIDLEFEDM